MKEQALKFDVVFFDCDSTLSAVEGIDELAKRAGVAEQLIPLTTAAMEGDMPLEEIYAKRLDLIQPDKSDLDWVCQRYLDEMVAGAKETVRALQAQGCSVHIISGGLRQAVLSVGEHLDIPGENIHAVEVVFDPQGKYQGFDQNSPLARAGGKAIVCRQVLHREQSAALIGDGITDLEAAEAGVYVIGFGGVTRREAVVQGAQKFIDEPSLLQALPLLIESK